MKKVLSLICFFVIVLSCVSVYSNDAESIFDGEQDYLILGTVKDVSEDKVIITVDNTVGVKTPSLMGEDIEIERFSYSYCEEHTPSDFNKPKIGDNIFASVSKNKDRYAIANGAYKVDSSEIKNCSTLVYRDMRGEECLESSVKIAYFIRSNGKITNFKTDSDGKIYALNDGDKILVYPLVGNQCIKFVDDYGKVLDEAAEDDVMPIVPSNSQKNNHHDRKWLAAIAIFSSGAILGFLVMLVFYARKRL